MTPQSYNVNKLAAATNYYFRMRYSNGSAPDIFSNLSNQASCTTLAWPSEVTYNYVGVTVDTNNHWAYELQLGDWSSSPTTPNQISKTEAENADYDAIEASDDSRWTIADPGSNNEPGIWCEFTIAENKSDVLRIDLNFEGYSDTSSALHQMWAYNASSGAWEKLGAAETIVGGGSDSTLERSITSGCANYIYTFDGKDHILCVVSSSATDNSMQVDYVEAVVTIPETDISPPASVYLEAVGESQCVYLEWLAPGDDDIVGTAAEYDLRYLTTGEVNESNWGSASNVSGEPTPDLSGAWQDMFVTNLSTSSTYYFALKTRDEVPNWADIFNSPSAVPEHTDNQEPSDITDLHCGNVTGRSVVLNWNASCDDDGKWYTGPAYYNDIRYSSSGVINDSNWGSATQCTGEPRPAEPFKADTFTVTGLSPQTKYWFAIEVGDEVINWCKSVSNSPNATTEEPWPQAIADLAVVAEWDRVKLTWTAPYEDYNDSMSGNCTEYDIRYSTSTITESNWEYAFQCTNESTPGTPGTTEVFLQTGLNEKQTYYFAIKARDTVWANWDDLSNVASVTVQQPQHDVGDWWMWYVHYDDFGEKGISNKYYLIQNVFAVNETVEVRKNESSTPFNVSGCARFDWSVDDRQTSNGSWGGARTDITGNVMVPSVKSRMYDAEMWSGARDATVRIRLDSNVGYYNLPYGLPDEDIAMLTSYTYQGNGSAPAAGDGYPFAIGDKMHQYEYKNRDTTPSSPLYNDFDWEVLSFKRNYNVSAQANISACDHDGNSSNAIYDVYEVYVTEPGESNTNEYWYSPKVHNIVRKYDQLSYFGLEEYGIVAYEVADFTKSGLNVSAATNPPNEGDTLTVSINVSNTTGEARKFNMLLLITDMNASTAVNGEPYYNGKTVFPDMSSDPSSTWPYYPAVKTTSVLQPGASETVTWSNIYTIPSSDPNHWYKVWCSGLTYGPWEAD